MLSGAMTDTSGESDQTMAFGLLLDQRDGMIVLGLPGTEYQLHLKLAGAALLPKNQMVRGRIRALAMRVDKVAGGGRFIEPLYGRPRRLQGRIIAASSQANTITVQCPCPVECQLTADQQASSFDVGHWVSFDVQRGATFHPSAWPG